MLSSRWRKVIRDLWLNKTRTSLVVLSMAIGIFAVGVTINAQIVLSDSLIEIYTATKPAHATILTLTPFDQDLVEAARNVEGVEEAEARRNVTVRLQTGPNEWINLQLAAIPDYEEIKVDEVQPEQGAWPPPEDEILIERSALGLTGANVGDTVTIRTPEGIERQVRIAGLSHDLQASIFVLSNIAYGHITMDTLEWLGEPRNFNELHIRVAEHQNDREYIKAVTDKVQDKIENSGRTVLFTLIPEPNQPPLNYVIQAATAILGAVGLLSLILSGFLVINIISAILTQQTTQIGAMKTFGARTGQLMLMYLTMVLAFGVLALTLALPLAAVSAFYMSQLIAGLLNFDLTEFQIPPLALILQVVVALVVPVVAGIFPVLTGTRITVREAISEQGLGRGQFGTNFIDRWLAGPITRFLLRWLARPTLISIRNTFRRKKRFLLTLATLVMGGTIFIAVSSLQASLRSTLNSWLNYYQYDVAVQLGRQYRVEKVTPVLSQLPGVVAVEGWGFYTTRRVRPDGTNSANITLFAPPPDTEVVRPTLVEGRWLRPEDFNAIVLNTMFLQNESDVEVGDEITLKIEGDETPWVVVGIVQGGSFTPTAFVSRDVLARVTGQLGEVEYVMVVTEEHSLEAQTRMSRAIEERLTEQGYRVGLTATAAQDKQTIESIFRIIFILLLVIAIVLAAVGGLGLMGTMSINVLERTREIGVMRAIGASTPSILRLILFEGMVIGAISWVIGALAALPLGKLLSDTVGELLLSSSLTYTISVTGLTGWLGLVIVLAAIASLLPALNAARLTVREVLAYE